MKGFALHPFIPSLLSVSIYFMFTARFYQVGLLVTVFLLLCVSFLYAGEDREVGKDGSYYTGLIIIPPSECISCGFSAINHITNALQSLNIAPSVILVNKPTSDNRSILKRNIMSPKAKRFVMTPDSLSKVFPFVPIGKDEQQGISIYIVDQRQRVVGSLSNLRTLDPSVVEKFLSAMADSIVNRQPLYPLRSFPLYEDDESPLVALSAVMARDSVLYISEAYEGLLIRKYSFRDGNLISTVAVDDTTKTFFLKEKQERDHFKQMNEIGMGQPYVSGFLKSNQSAYALINTIHHFIADTTFFTNEKGNLDTLINISFADGQILLDIAGDSPSRKRAFFHQYYQVRKMQLLNDSMAIGHLDFRANLNDPASIDKGSLAVIGLVKFRKGETVDIAPILTHKMLHGTGPDLEYSEEFIFASTDQSRGFLMSAAVNGLWQYSVLGDSLTLKRWRPQGILEKVMQQDYRINPDSLLLRLANAVVIKNRLYILIRGTKVSAPQVIVQQYSLESEHPVLVAEQIVDTKDLAHDDGILFTDILSCDNTSLLLLTKSESKRWMLSQLPTQ